MFSYLILCNFFPLYDIESDVCAVFTDPEQVDNTPKTESSNNITSKRNTTIPYGLQKHDQPAIEEYILLIWVSTLLIEELRQVMQH